jgi:hypothetical protein
MRTKAIVREQIQSDMQQFLQNGGKLTKLPTRKTSTRIAGQKSVDTNILKDVPASLKKKLGIA